jgi:hypothetical protein
MSEEKPIFYRLTTTKIPKLSMEERVLLYLVQHDLDAGRDGDVSDWFGDMREAIFMFSSYFLHSAELTFLNILYWEELREYGHPDKWGEGGIELPPNHEGLASIPQGKRRSFSLALKKLIKGEFIHAFVPSMRAIKGLGGKKTPLLQLWAEHNRDKLRDIVAISLTEKGFKRAKEVADKYSVMMPWQVHKFLVKDREFAKWLTGRKEKLQNPAEN